MTRSHQVLNLTGVFLPLLGVLAAIVLLWDKAVGWTSLAVLAAMYVVSVMGVTLVAVWLIDRAVFSRTAAPAAS